MGMPHNYKSEQEANTVHSRLLHVLKAFVKDNNFIAKRFLSTIVAG